MEGLDVLNVSDEVFFLSLVNNCNRSTHNGTGNLFLERSTQHKNDHDDNDDDDTPIAPLPNFLRKINFVSIE